MGGECGDWGDGVPVRWDRTERWCEVSDDVTPQDDTRLPWWVWPFVVVFVPPLLATATGIGFLLWAYYYHERFEE